MRALLGLLVFAIVVVCFVDGWKPSSTRNRHENQDLPEATVGLIVPHTSFEVRGYNKSIMKAVNGLRKIRLADASGLTFLNKYKFTPNQVKTVLMKLTPSPTGTDQINIKYFSSHFSSFRDENDNRIEFSIVRGKKKKIFESDCGKMCVNYTLERMSNNRLRNQAFCMENTGLNSK